MSHSNPDVTLEDKYFIKQASNYEVVFIGKKINGNKSTSVANESQVYSTVH